MENIIKDREILLTSLLEVIELYYDKDHISNEIYNKIKDDHLDHYLSISQDDFDKISYANKVEHKFSSEHRIKTTFERYVRRQLKVDECHISDDCLNYIGRLLRSKAIPVHLISKDIQILSGKDIISFYQDINIESCMSGGNSYKTELYALNPEIIKLVTYKNSARGLLWYHNSGNIILDRTYPNNSEKAELLKTWAKNNKYIYRISNGYCPSNDGYIKLSNNHNYEFELIHNKIFPYLDTFCFGIYDKNNKKILVSNLRNNNYHNVVLHSSEGEYISLVKCISCLNMFAKNMCMYKDNFYCKNCFNEKFTTCWYCGDSIKNDQIILINEKKICPKCRHDSVVNCFYCNKHVFVCYVINYNDNHCCGNCYDSFD